MEYYFNRTYKKVWTSQVALMVKKPLANEGDVTDKGSVQSLGQEDPLEEGIATHSSILA